MLFAVAFLLPLHNENLQTYTDKERIYTNKGNIQIFLVTVSD